MAYRDALIGKFGEEFRDVVLKAEQTFSPEKHNRRRCELFCDRCKVKYHILPDGFIPRLAGHADRAFRYDLAFFGVEPYALESAFSWAARARFSIIVFLSIKAILLYYFAFL